MGEVTVEELVMRIEIELDRFRSQANQAEGIDKRLRKSLDETRESAKEAGEGFDSLGDEVSESSKAMASKIKTVVDLTSRMVRFFGVIAGSNAVQQFGNSIARANDQLNFMSRRLGMTGREIRGIDTAVAALGGSGASAQATLLQLNQGIQEMVLMGNDALIPFFSALGVGVVDASGDIRDMGDILLDMSDSLSQMDPQQAYALASAMGLDAGVANALIQGRDAMREMLDMYESVYVSTEEEMAASRELSRMQAQLAAQWEGLKTIIGNALIPTLIRMTDIVSGWMDYLNRNERAVRNFFEGISIAIGVVLLPLLAKAAVGIAAMLSPILGTAAVVALLAGAFALLYDDYKTWAAGGESLFDWGRFIQYIDDAEFSVSNLWSSLTFLITGYTSLTEASEAFMGWLRDTGIIDEHGVSIKRLGEAFRELGREVVDAIPGLRLALELIAAAMERDWSTVGRLARQMPAEVASGIGRIGFDVAERGYGAIDVLTGHDPSEEGSLASYVRRIERWAFDDEQPIEEIFHEAEEEAGLPPGTLEAIRQQETSGSQEYIDDPEKYHYGLDASGRRIAPHTGQISTAFGPFGILESTASDPGYGVAPLRNKSLKEQARFAAQYLAARSRHAGSLEGGLAGYGEGETYSSAVMARGLIGNPTISAGGVAGSSSGGSVEVSINSVNVNTSATDLPTATREGVEAGVARGSDLLNQLGGGL